MGFLSLLAVLGGALYAIVPPVVEEVASFVTTILNLIGNLTVNNLDVKFHLLSAAEFGVRAEHQQRSSRQHRLGRCDGPGSPPTRW